MNFQGRAGATALIGMSGFVVGAQALVDGEWHLAVETTAARVACPGPGCGTRATGHGRRRVTVRDLPVSGRPVVLCWAKRLWCCTDGDCEKATWTEVVTDWLEARPDDWLAGVSVAAIDAFRGYATALGSGLPAATLVMDCFHAVALAKRCIDAVRRRVQNDTLDHRGRRDDPVYRIRRVALVGAERLNDKGWQRLLAGMAAGDPTGHLAAAWIAKEELRRVYAARSEHSARRALTRFYLHCAGHDHVPGILRLAKTVSAWEDQILAYHRTGRASNGPTEAVNRLIEKTRRIGHGFRNFDNYRLRLLLACGVR